MKNLIIIGASGFGREVAWLVERINQIRPTWKILGFLDDNIALQGQLVGNYVVLGQLSSALDYLDAYFVCAIGASRTRKKVIENLDSLSEGLMKYAILIDPSVLDVGSNPIGQGSIICGGSILTVDYSIGKHVIINLSCTIGHDAILHDFVTLYPTVNVSGNVIISEGVEIGTGSKVIQGKKIGQESIIGAGAVIVKDIPPFCTAVGVPAIPIKYHEQAN